MITIEQLAALPVLYRETIPASYLDLNGHMNARWYLALFSEASWEQYRLIGMPADYFRVEKSGGFTLKIFLQFFAEIHAGDQIAIRCRVLGRSAKRWHYMALMTNETTGMVACIGEGLDTHADLTARRATPFPDHIAAQLDKVIAEHQQLGWDAPICGSIQP